MDLADAEGLDAVSMRRLGQQLEVEAMSIYNHVRGKEALTSGMVGLVFDEILDELDQATRPVPEVDWKGALRTRSLTARTVMLRHPWAPTLLESRGELGESAVRFFDGVVGTLLAGGFSHDLAHHAIHALGSRVVGFTQELFDPGAGADEEAMAALASIAPQIPHLAAMVNVIAHEESDTTLGWCDDQQEFEFGLDVVLAGLEARLREARDAGE